MFERPPTEKYRNALLDIINVLGPDIPIAGCPDCNNSCEGLKVEAEEALRLAKEALDGG